MPLQDEYVLNLASKGTRIDSRKPDEFRKITIEKNPIPKAEGSARVKIGDTEILAGVKIDVGQPFPDKLDEGVLMVGAEFSPLASPLFELGPPRENAIELARVIDRGIRESQTIDTKKLCIKEGEKVWMVHVDIHILNHAGNLIDAAALASITALTNARMPQYTKDKVDYEKKTDKSLPLRFKPVAVTFAKINGNIFMDPVLEEENVMAARLTVTTKEDGNICAIQKGGSTPLTLDEINKSIEQSIKKGKELRKLI